MKKILALVLAVVMTMGLATVAFAADPVLSITSGSNVFSVSNGAASYLCNIDGLGDVILTPGGTYYISINADGINTALKSTPEVAASAFKKYEIYADWSVGSIDSFDIQLKKIPLYDDVVDTDGDAALGFAGGDLAYRNVIVFKVAEKSATTPYDIAGTIKLAESASKAKNVDPVTFGAEVAPATATVENEVSYNVAKGVGAVTFKNCDDIELTFAELALYETNVSSQSSALNLSWNTTFNSEFAAKYDYANIDFITWSKTPVFNRNGDLYIYADEDTFIYEVTANGAKEIKKAEYDDAYGAWKITTRKLGSYAISDVELKAEVEAPSTDVAVKPNPNTGR